MVLEGTTFSPEVQQRIKKYAITTDPQINPKSNPFVEKIATIKLGKNRVQAAPIPGSQESGYSAIYRNIHTPDRLISSSHPKVATVIDLFEASVAHGPNQPCMGQRSFNQESKSWGPFTYETYAQVKQRAIDTASGIINIVEKANSIEPNKKQYVVGLYGPNTRNWVVADLACAYTALTSVPLYDTLGPESTQYIINLTEMPIIFASLAHIPYLLSIKDKLPLLKTLVSLNEFESPEFYEQPGYGKRDLVTKWAASVGVTVYSMSEVEAIGQKSPRKLRKLVPEDIQSLCFTSGTTGLPKGVIISASAVVAGVCVSKYQEAFETAVGQVTYLSFLPLAHIYERVDIYSLLANNSKVGFFHGEVTELFDDIQVLQPTLLAGVPRVWNRMAAAIKASTIEADGFAGVLSRKAFNTKVTRLRETGVYTHALWDRLWSNKIRTKLGLGSTKAFISGSAPLAGENIELLKAALAIDLLQGYGLTESLSGVSVCMMGDIGAGSVGPVAPTTEIRLRELPDMNYLSTDKPYPRGEILLRGPQMFWGYFKNEEETKKAIDEDGWFHTGDVGMIDDLGRIYIIDRVKNMFKLAQGEYVGPERIESIYQSSSSLIAQIFVEGNSLEVFLIAIVGVLPEAYVAFLKHHFGLHIDPTDTAAMTETFKRLDIRRAINEEINKDAKRAGLKGFELVKNLALFLEPMNADNGTLTPTLKVKRKEAAVLYKDTIDGLYKEGQIVESSTKAKL
ncbi:uncharacterized protein SAPINGB_P001529 [Magnusiomyces paraingens]|uniref:AMP-dependent synthetase/ligase domain-containing protein n=1 Tax=Magnusiomyces paraingens TaxID=2606893 RepID=A0A5E8B6S5_9ASCO|nr:uncharacterized protein SAPINGB_P001529 [Saprochaete ingens]VVT47072.1 unnamed protein product [Saprochaete ingens]